MRTLERLRYDAAAPLGRAHPLAKLAAAAIVMLALFVGSDLVASTVALAATIGAAAAAGIAPRPLATRAAPVVVGAAGIGAFNAIVSGDAQAGLAVALRLVGIALVGIVALATIEPTELADALVEHLHASPRFAVGALAAFRLLPLFVREWEIGGLARRARGIDAGGGPLTRARDVAERTLALLIAAVRRASALALAMDARGFGLRACRTVARPRPLVRGDAALIAGATALAVTVLAVAALRRGGA